MKRSLRIRRRAHGFSLVELMVGMAVGLIMLAAIIALTVSMLRANAEAVALARVTQEGRAIGDLISRELRRSRYTGNYIQLVGTAGTIPNAFDSITIRNGGPNSGSCIEFAYDTDDDGLIGVGEVKVVTLGADGAIYMGQYAAFDATNCSAPNATALRVSSVDTNISTLTFSRDAALNPNEIGVQLRVSLAGNANVVRRFDQIVQVRNPFLAP